MTKFGEENFNIKGRVSLDLMFDPPDYKKRNVESEKYLPISLRGKNERTCRKDKQTCAGK